MRNIFILLVLFLGFNYGTSQNLKPYIVGFESVTNINTVKKELVENLKDNNLEIIGQYKPANDDNRWIIVVSSNELISAVKKVKGLTGFAASQRIGLYASNGKTIVSFTNPKYWGNAYFRNDFNKVSSFYDTFEKKITESMKASGSYSGKGFGSEDGISVNTLRKYHYMIGMPYFDDTVVLNKFGSYDEAITSVHSNLNAGVGNVSLVYKVEFPGEDLCLYGVALSGSEGEGKFVPIIDINEPKHVAFLPYEFLVKGNEVHMLHGRYRIALSFPDLTMRTFTKIMSTPGDIEDLVKSVVQ